MDKNCGKQCQENNEAFRFINALAEFNQRSNGLYQHLRHHADRISLPSKTISGYGDSMYINEGKNNNLEQKIFDRKMNWNNPLFYHEVKKSITLKVSDSSPLLAFIL